MITCQRCRWSYPNENFVSEIKMQGEHPDNHKRVCSICALEIHNEYKGTSHERWPITLAEISRVAALEWRERHPELAP